MKQLNMAAAAGLLVVLFAGAGYAQKKTTKKSVTKKPTAPTVLLPPLEVRAAREKVMIQRDNVDSFVDALGPIAQAIETLDESAKTKPLPQKTADRNEANKQKVVQAIRNLKDGLANLEAEFRTKAALQKYLSSIEGITDLCSQSEDTAIAGKFVSSKEPLRTVWQKLTDTLAALPR